MTAPDPKDSLGSTLAAWRVEPPRDPQFRRAVWARLEAARGAPTWSSYVRGHATLVAGAFAFAVVLGAVTGRGQARARVEAESRQLAASYVESLDARSMRMP
jgi:hypothetical protein